MPILGWDRYVDVYCLGTRVVWEPALSNTGKYWEIQQLSSTMEDNDVIFHYFLVFASISREIPVFPIVLGNPIISQLFDNPAWYINKLGFLKMPVECHIMQLLGLWLELQMPLFYGHSKRLHVINGPLIWGCVLLLLDKRNGSLLHLVGTSVCLSVTISFVNVII